MHIGRQILQEIELEFGEPAVEHWSFPMLPEEFAVLKKHLGLGRAHDVSPLIVRGNELAVIRKVDYPPGAYRIPSGGVHPEESFVDGVAREAREETGLIVELERYLLHVEVAFSHGQETARWATHVLLARPVSGELQPHDRHEVLSARWMTWDELLNDSNRVLRQTGLGGLTYRARLHERAHELWMGAKGDEAK